MIAGGAQFFGKNLPSIQDIDVSPSRAAQLASVTAYDRPSPESLQLDKQFIDGLLKQERIKVSGQD
jgi:hypothetical protein